MVVGAIEESDDENRLDALFSSQVQKDRSGKFSMTRYSSYTRQQKQRKLSVKRGFKTVMSKLMNKKVSVLHKSRSELIVF